MFIEFVLYGYARDLRRVPPGLTQGIGPLMPGITAVAAAVSALRLGNLSVHLTTPRKVVALLLSSVNAGIPPPTAS